MGAHDTSAFFVNVLLFQEVYLTIDYLFLILRRQRNRINMTDYSHKCFTTQILVWHALIRWIDDDVWLRMAVETPYILMNIQE